MLRKSSHALPASHDHAAVPFPTLDAMVLLHRLHLQLSIQRRRLTSFIRHEPLLCALVPALGRGAIPIHRLPEIGFGPDTRLGKLISQNSRGVCV